MTTKEEWKTKTARLKRQRLKPKFVVAGGDLKSKEAVPPRLELTNAFNEVSLCSGHPILKNVNEEPTTPSAYLQQRIDQKTREVAKRTNNAGLVAMWPEALKEVLAKFPNLSPAEKAALRSNTAVQLHLTKQIVLRSSRDLAVTRAVQT